MSYQNKYLKYKNKYLDLKKQIGGSSNSANSSICGICLGEIDCTNKTSIILECGCCIHVDCLCASFTNLLNTSGQISNLECPSKATGNQHEDTSPAHLMNEKVKITDEKCQGEMDKLIKRLVENTNFVSSGETDKKTAQLISLTSRACPNQSCNYPAVRPHGHACHHVMGCPSCKLHYCFVCGSIEATHNCSYKGRRLGSTWSSYCKTEITEEDIDYSTGIPRDNRCGCAFCSDCRFGKKCEQCNGTCLVCKGIVKPGPTEVLPESERRNWSLLELPNIIDAAEAGNLPLVESFIQGGAKVNIQNKHRQTALMRASEQGHEAIVNALITANAYVNMIDNMKRSALIFASEYGNGVIVDSLIRAGADVNIQGLGETTALIWVSRTGNKAIFDALIEEDADVNIVDEYGKSALMYASLEGHEAIVDTLITSGAKVNICDKYGKTALMYASMNGNETIVNALIKARTKVNVNIQDKIGKTALIHASEKGDMVIVDALIKTGALVNIKDGDGKTALKHASEKGHMSIVDALIAAGAKP